MEGFKKIKKYIQYRSSRKTVQERNYREETVQGCGGEKAV